MTTQLIKNTKTETNHRNAAGKYFVLRLLALRESKYGFKQT